MQVKNSHECMKTTSIQFNDQYNNVQSFSLYDKTTESDKFTENNKSRVFTDIQYKGPQTVFPGRLWPNRKLVITFTCHILIPDTVTATEVRFGSERQCQSSKLIPFLKWRLLHTWRRSIAQNLIFSSHQSIANNHVASVFQKSDKTYQ
jgi:hypothetical protein